MSIPRDNELTQYDYSYQQRLELKVHELEMERMYQEDLFTNSYLSPAHKIILLTIRRIIRALRIDDTSPVVIHLNELVYKTGISEQQLRRLLNELDKWGLITKSTKQWKEGKRWTSEMTIAMGGQIKIDTAKPERNHGGLRKQKCHNCGSENVEATVYQCKDCGHYGPFDTD